MNSARTTDTLPTRIEENFHELPTLEKRYSEWELTEGESGCLYFLIFIVLLFCMYVLPALVVLYHVHAVPLEVRRGH